MRLTLTLAALLGAALALPTGMPPRPIATDDPLQDLPEFQAVNGTNDSTVTTDPFGDVDLPHPKPEFPCKGASPYCGSRHNFWNFWSDPIRGIAPRGDGHHDKHDQSWGSAIKDLWRFVWNRDEGAVAPRGDGHHDKQDQTWGSAIKDLWRFIWKRDEGAGGEKDPGPCDEGEADPAEEWSKRIRDPQDVESDRAVVDARDVAVRDDDGENPCEKKIKPADVLFVFSAYDKGLKCAKWRKEQKEKWNNN
ncbi:hypothetical protein M409DRAFT_55265 [Zasmidium cellare ATCC 36951]|uniref:Uncharacterized protein n=1 Tax=Zasmidium cellare ATCC 36951 TaxID=1080233 RepID=A0A6A6CIV5_ZASCE|nr:uncharacterized protein M409DRAFT_55265 [Zasmidium cellare ATCC 36951]KAF2165892.1 hypothetical protein M409DRAFT_55265 [Zasmidium cellare ATCC 36951]